MAGTVSLSHNRKSHARLRRIDFRAAVNYSRLISFERLELPGKPNGLEKTYSTNDYWAEFMKTTGDIAVDYRADRSPTV
jgi:hypothetical protein